MNISYFIRNLMLFLILGSVVANYPVHAESSGSDVVVKYEAEADALTLDAHNADLIVVLRKISQQANIRVLVDPEVTGTVSASFSRRPMQAALSGILRDFSVVTLYARQDDVPEGGLRVSELHILPQGKTDNGMLRSIEELQQDDLKQQRLSRSRQNREKNSARRNAAEEEKLKKRLERISALKETNPALYEKKMQRLRTKYPELVEQFEKREK
ncbi:hypothetical protein [Sedimenticola sp.]|uniref:hypothetical protein n=1 Tax=Sedimenticola sp. TaxID=1940285 RepID=UPI003D11455B